MLRYWVVICLKNRTFAVSQTTGSRSSARCVALWFAWKIVLLQYRKQPNLRTIIVVKVVICLKNRTFAVSQTTRGKHMPLRQVLWFAWKIVLLQYRKQPISKSEPVSAGCDLLEKSYFCSIANNRIWHEKELINVVICLKNRTFAVSQTTQRI